ncbi:Serine/threonine protein kinase and Signal transduction histidine kinase (STHK) with GAF sensor [Vibrio ichthyoenteri ATCC 700023]|uniref:Serine/threonine protein kinase and Signal transduction histidine kinase (STHK) with GAF sensor n=1 Tax=Vibrio ichthyoenteri ATCC 700023 TaxID=870968 RepID=F9S740_9VIBR|nr:diguanylate cyclase [Vibrio ichthyoenteri]EGU32020.1 Serine/threonine protein kinase and Signal transduction histidine kinase (STHK) with GAF sensor [Vibrio ichthyoenteri ATCC 700023]
MLLEGFSEIELIYRGHQSYVYKAKRVADQTFVTLKTPASAFPEPHQLAALKREHLILQSLDGSGLPTPLGYIEAKNTAFLVREWVEGISLRDYFKSHTISLASAIEISTKITRLIGLLHRQSYCHRDISSGNILINPENGDITLIDFCSSLEFPNKARNIIRPKFIEGSRAYMSPEQTGRMNRGLDFRTDFYSLGVLLYQLFTGRLPFETKDTNELIHSHIALEPTPIYQLFPHIPRVLSKLVKKLMSKSPDARYQSAEGVCADLDRCLQSWIQKGGIDDFELATHELHDWFILPEKLYGREAEISQLLEAFTHTTNQNGQLVFVAGHSGIGKTSLIRELYRPLTAQGGYITSGKYDQILRHQPYSAILQALAGFIKQVMAEDKVTIQFWRQQILDGVGKNAALLIEALPELEWIIGEQPSVQNLTMEAASTRFHTTFLNLLTALGQTGKPVILFIDDLQWIDPPSLTLLEAIAPTLSHSSLMIIAAYRNNEVNESHPLTMAMPNLRANCPNIVNIDLTELPTSVLQQILSDSVELPSTDAQQLNQLLFERTSGNPLIYKTMLATIHAKGHLYFDYQKKQWNWHKSAIAKLPKAENSVPMLQSYMEKLPSQTYKLLQLAGCIGNTFSLELLADLALASTHSVATALLPTVTQGLLLPLDDDFELHTIETREQLPDITLRFAHDRIQQAAYTSVSPSEQIKLHWQIGQHLLTQIEHQHCDHKLFDAAEHLNQGRENATQEQQLMLVELNLKVGKKANQSAAYSIAFSCLEQAYEMAARCGSLISTPLSIEVRLAYAQACYLVSKFDQAEEMYRLLRTTLTDKKDKLRLANMQAKQYHHQGLYQKSVEFEYEALALLGICLPETDEELTALFAEEKQQIEQLLQHQDLDALFNQPEIDDAEFMLAQELLFDMFADSYLLGRGPLIATAAAVSARLSIQQGNCSITSVGFINYASVLCSSGEYQQGHAIGSLAIKLADKYQNPTFKNYTYHVFSLGINHWLAPLKSSYYYWYEASKLSQESGSPFAGWVFLQLPHLLLASNAHLNEVEAQAVDSLNYLSSNRLEDMAQLLNIIVYQPLRHLKGQTHSFLSLDDDDFSTQKTLESYKDAPFFLGHTIYSVLRATLLARETLPTEQLLEWLSVIENTVQAQIILVDSYLYTGLHLTANCSQLTGAEREKLLNSIHSIVTKFKLWAELYPANYLHKYLMLSAEIARLENDSMLALDYYERARESALESQFLLDAALSDELTALFWQEKNKDYQAQAYLRRALSGYEQWGAVGKVDWLVHHYPELNTGHEIQAAKLNTTVSSTLGSDDFSANLDMGSVVKASQAVSQHIHMESLAEELLDLAVENAGATRGLLLLERNGEFLVTHQIDSEESVDGNNEPIHAENRINSLSNDDVFSHAIIRYVVNIGEAAVYTPNDNNEQFERCPYLNSRRNISVLCVPIVRGKKMSGMLYLENHHMADAFHANRVQTLKIIASQAAISLENAKMYQDLEALNQNLEGIVQERTQALHDANATLTEQNTTLYKLSTTDQLTGLYNRRYIEEQISTALYNLEENNQPISILMLDVDHFKAINDTYGHNMGDKVLVNVANSILQSTEPGDIQGRWGGEEFVVLCPYNVNLATNRAESIRRNISKIDLLEAGNVTVSVGVTSCLIQDSIDSVLNRVDQALYEAKNSGRNQVIIKMK